LIRSLRFSDELQDHIEGFGLLSFLRRLSHFHKGSWILGEFSTVLGLPNKTPGEDTLKAIADEVFLSLYWFLLYAPSNC
jgi:hypothetical protein